jgi:xanthine dehydrogenase accessory factor
LGELTQLAEAAEAWRAEGVAAALATVVAVRGSAYRREGAKMLLGPGQRMHGTLSGGCLEPELLVAAEEVLASGRGRTLEYDLSEEAMWGLGIGCGGQVRVQVAPLDPALPEVWRRVESQGEAWAVVTPLEGRGAVLVGPGEEGPAQGALADEAWTRAAEAAGRARLAGVRPGIEALPQGDVFVDVMAPPPLLCLFGAGHDAVPVAALAQRTGFRVRVVDPRPAYATAERFPGAEVVLADVRTDPATADLAPAGSFAVVMHHHLERDTAALERLAAGRARYVGALGPRSRTERMLAELEGRGVDTAPLRRVLASPVGLDIGAEGAEAIAVAVVAELLALRAGRAGGRLATADGTIHAR